MTPRIQWQGLCVQSKHMALGRCKKEFRSDSSFCFCSDLSEDRRLSGWMTCFILTPLQTAEPAAAARAVLKALQTAPSVCWSMWKGRCRFGSLPCLRGAKAACHQRYSHIRVKIDPVFLELFKTEQWSLSKTFLSGFRIYPEKNRPDLMILVGPHQVWCCTFKCIPGGFCHSYSECSWLSWRWQGPPPSQITHLAMPMDSPTVRGKHVLLLHLWARRSPQQPINPFQTHIGSHMCFLVAWFLAREATLILLLDLCACLLFIMCELKERPWTGERETNDCHIVSSSLQAEEAVWTFP